MKGGGSERFVLPAKIYSTDYNRLNMCHTSSKFMALVHSCTSWDIELEDDSAGKLARFSSAVKIIKSLKLSYSFDVDYVNDSNDQLNEDDFYKFLRNHPEIKSLSLFRVNSETLSYIGYFCTDLRHLRIGLIPSSRTSFRLGFNNLDSLNLSILNNSIEKRKNTEFLIKNLSALPRLRVLVLNFHIAFDYEVMENTDNVAKMKALEVLFLGNNTEAITLKIIKACSASLRKISFKSIKDDELFALLEHCPNLRSVALLKDLNISHQGYSVLFKQLGRQMEYFNINVDKDDGAFTSQDLEELISSKPTQLTALSLRLDWEDHISSEGFIKLIEKHGRQFKHLYIRESFGLTAEVLLAAVENCPLVVQQGEWEIGSFNVEPADISVFVANCGASLKILSAPVACTDRNLEELAARCPNLHALDLSGCQEVTDAGLAGFLANCKGLRTLDILSTELVKLETFIKVTYPNLRIGSLDADYSCWL